MRIAFCFIVLFGCFFHTANAGKIVIKGKAAHFTGDSLDFSYELYKILQGQKVRKVPVKNGAFSFTIDSDVPLRGFFSFGRVPVIEKFTFSRADGRDSTTSTNTNDSRLVILYLEPGDVLNMKLDINDIEHTLHFSGSTADNNIFVNKEEWILNSYKEKFLRNYYEPVSYAPDAFTGLAKRRFGYKINFLDSMSRVYKLSPALKDVFYWKFYAEWVMSRMYYPSTKETYTAEKVKLPPGYFAFVRDVKTAEEGGNKGIGYFYFLDAVMRKKYEMRADTTLSLTAFVKQNMTGKAQYEYLAYTLGKNFNPEVLDMFGSNCPYPEMAVLVKERYKNMKGMMPGSPAPVVTLLTADGKSFSFADYKGKYIYVDFWATWCGPCIKEIPSLINLEKEYHGKEITFLSVSFDKDLDAQKWKDYIKNNPMVSNQFRADAPGQSLLTKSWNISMIPRFAILDKNGNVIDANAPFPSSKEIRPALNKLL